MSEDIEFKQRLIALTEENGEINRRTCAALGDLRREIKNGYLVAASVIIVALMALLLWFGKLDTRMFACFTSACLFPWYGTGFERILRVWRGERGGLNKRDSRALGLLFLGVLVLITGKGV